jgi:hypothetical protein
MPDRIVRYNGIPEHTEYCDCLHCRLEWEADQEEQYAVRLLAAQDEQVRQAKPATDAEWAEFMDAEWPRAKEGVA